MPKKGTRRLDADDPRYADLPVVAMNPVTAQIDVIRGPFRVTPGFSSQLGWLSDRPGHPHVVFASRRDDVVVIPVGSFVSADDADDPRTRSSWALPSFSQCATLAEVAALLHAAARELSALAADGWLLEAPPDSRLQLRDSRI